MPTSTESDNCGCEGSHLCLAHKLAYWRDGNLQVSPAATPNRRNQVAPVHRESVNAYERGVPTDERGMPYLGKDFKPLGAKPFAEKRRAFEERRRAHHVSP